MMKILQLIHKPQMRGAEIFASQLSNHLFKMGHTVKLVALYSGDAPLPFYGKIEILDANTFKKLIDIKAWEKLSRIIEDFQPDILQANSGDTLKYAVFSKLFFRWKTPIISRNASEVGRYLKSSSQRRLNGFLYKKVAGIISVSKASEKDLLTHFPFLKGKTEIIPVGLEEGVGMPPIVLKPENIKHIVHVGGFSFEKNHIGLISILQRLLIESPNIHLHLIGDGILRREIEEKVKHLNLVDNVTFHGFVNNPLPYISAADALVLPSIIEGLPGVILEAMFCKTPVIAYDVGGISEIVNEYTGSLIPQGEEEKFASEVLFQINNSKPDNLNVGYNLVISKFMNNTLAMKFLKNYQTY